MLRARFQFKKNHYYRKKHTLSGSIQIEGRGKGNARKPSEFRKTNINH